MDKDTQSTGTNVPIGYADEIKELLLLDDNDQPVELDQPGELVVKSCYLAPGYWRRPDLTESRFLPDPDGGDERIYRTGDIGLVRSDGSIIHLGRRDFQIKIRGSRAEVAEIEKALLDLGSIQEAAVVAREYESGGQRLVAYIVPQKRPAPTVTALRRELSEQFPDYMIPSVFVILDALPLTATGKIDHLALPDPGKERPGLDIPFVAPRSPIEKTLAEIWSQVLDLDEIGVHDSFFELGGHSLLVTQIVSRVDRTFRVKVPIQSLFQSPTVADLAVIISQNQSEEMEHKDIERMLTELDMLSDEELEQLLANEEIRDGNTDKRS